MDSGMSMHSGYSGTSLTTGLGVLFILLLGWLFFGNGIGGRNNAADNCRDLWENQKQEIIDTAQIRYDAIDQGNQTREAVRIENEKVREQASRIYEAQQSEKIFDLKAENTALKSQLYSDAKFNEVFRMIETLSCETPKRPAFYATGATACGNPVNYCCG